jgi:hypothetical protein
MGVTSIVPVRAAGAYLSWPSFAWTRGRLGVEPRDEHVLPGANQLFGDRRHLLRGLRFAGKDFRHTGSQLPVMVDRGKAEVAKRQVAQLGQRRGDVPFCRRGPLRVAP